MVQIIDIFLFFGLTFFYGGLAFLFVGIPLGFVIAEYTPPDLIAKYMRKPHYKKMECYVYSQYPAKYVRGMHFAASISWPFLARKRKMESVKEHAPVWFKLLSYFYCWALFLPAFLGMVISLTLLPFV